MWFLRFFVNEDNNITVAFRKKIHYNNSYIVSAFANMHSSYKEGR